MIVKLTSETLAELGGAKDATECQSKISDLIQKNKTLSTAMSDQTASMDALLKRIDALEAKLVTKDSLSAEVKTAVTEACSGIKTEAKTEASAAASKMVTDALAAIGTTPAKPAPISSEPSAEDRIKSLEAAGKFEEAFALLPASTRAEFMGNHKAYASYRKAAMSGQARIR
jgi:hypothetical protein